MKGNKELWCFGRWVQESVPLGILLALVGGMLDAYTYLERGHVFANAQTGNMVLLSVYASQGNWGQALAHIPPIIAFIAGVLVTEEIKNNLSRFFAWDWKQIVIMLEMIIFFIIGWLPHTVPNSLVTVTVSFIASIQVTSFPKLVDAPYNTTVSTGNLRTASQQAYIAFTQKDYPAAFRAIRFFLIVLAFLSGAFLGGILTRVAGVKAIWGGAVILLVAAMLFTLCQRKGEKNLV